MLLYKSHERTIPQAPSCCVRRLDGIQHALNAQVDGGPHARTTCQAGEHGKSHNRRSNPSFVECWQADAVKLLLLLQLLTSKNCARTNPRPRHPETLREDAPHIMSSCPRVGRTPIENDPLTQDWPQVRRLRTSRIRVRFRCCFCCCCDKACV